MPGGQVLVRADVRWPPNRWAFSRASPKLVRASPCRSRSASGERSAQITNSGAPVWDEADDRQQFITAGDLPGAWDEVPGASDAVTGKRHGQLLSFTLSSR